MQFLIVNNVTSNDSRTPKERELMEGYINEYLTGKKKKKKKRKGFAELLPGRKH
ncbi:hypothetical protein QUA27_25610 [Microcoleus sp. Pol14C6]|uniref:hypothetical protein n=1 Tax=unclassified Microcoleus TaxID=2642155 RepID=UPI002FD3329D